MQNLYLRLEKGAPLTWEELDTNWLRLKQAVETLEAEAEDWHLPLYVEGDETSTPATWLGVAKVLEPDIAGLHQREADRNAVAWPEGLFGWSGNGRAVVRVYGGDEAEVWLSAMAVTPMLFTGLRLEADRCVLTTHGGVALTVEHRTGGRLRVGFFGQKAEQQAISIDSADAAVQELQAILIAYGLAVDQRG